MSGDRRRDRPTPETGSRGALPPRQSTPGNVISTGDRDRVRAGESEPPTRPRGRTISDSEMPAESRASVTEDMERDYQQIASRLKQDAASIQPIGFISPGQLSPRNDRRD